MCTVTWLPGAHGYELFFNRDEKRTRKPGLPPQAVTRDAVRLIHPTDGDAGGSWIGVNDCGLTVCLLNHHPSPAACQPPPTTLASRGHALLSLLSCRGVADAVARAQGLRPESYRPFILVAVDPRHPARALVSDGKSLREQPVRAPPFLTTSSFDTAAVTLSRRAVFDRCVAGSRSLDAETLFALHRSHDPERGPYSICMHRPDAETVSFSHIVVGRDTVRFTYGDGAPCQARSSEPVEIPRRVIP